MCCCSVGIIIMKHALCLCSFTPFVPFFPFFPSLFVPACCSLPNISSLLSPVSFETCHSSTSHYLCSSNLVFFFLSPPLTCSPSRGAGVIGALSLLGQRATRSGQRTLRAGFCPGCRPSVCPPLRPSPRTHPAAAPPGRAGPRDAKVRKLNTPLVFNITFDGDKCTCKWSCSQIWRIVSG